MKLNQWAQIILVGCSVLTLAACSSTHKNRDGTAINDANANYSDAQSTGLGDDSNFGDQANGGRKTVATNKRTYYFDYDSNVVRTDDRTAIVSNATKISQAQAKVMLEGHTDPRGSREYNIGLGERRAKAVADVMTEKGVQPDQIRVVSYGAEKLAANGHTNNDYQLDRRVVLVNVQR
jgi:peptidoglycan-associated lipoprotein